MDAIETLSNLISDKPEKAKYQVNLDGIEKKLLEMQERSDLSLTEREAIDEMVSTEAFQETLLDWLLNDPEDIINLINVALATPSFEDSDLNLLATGEINKEDKNVLLNYTHGIQAFNRFAGYQVDSVDWIVSEANALFLRVMANNPKFDAKITFSNFVSLFNHETIGPKLAGMLYTDPRAVTRLTTYAINANNLLLNEQAGVSEDSAETIEIFLDEEIRLNQTYGFGLPPEVDDHMRDVDQLRLTANQGSQLNILVSDERVLQQYTDLVLNNREKAIKTVKEARSRGFLDVEKIEDEHIVKIKEYMSRS